MTTLSALVGYCKKQARVSSRDYFQPGYAKVDEIAAWRSDCARRNAQRKACLNLFADRFANAQDEPLVPGSYGRLSIFEDGSFEYTACQYSPLEIYPALHNYLEVTR
jgi:hypothetical protein